MVLAGVFKARNVENRRPLPIRCARRLLPRWRREPIVDDGDLLRRHLPELHEVRRRRPRDRHQAVHLLRVMRQHARDVEHPERVVLLRHVIRREVVDDPDRRQRTAPQGAAVRRKHEQRVEVARPDPSRQDEEMPEHREDGAARAARRLDRTKAGEEARGDARLRDERERVALRRERTDDVPRVLRKPRPAAVEGDDVHEQPHATSSSACANAATSPAGTSRHPPSAHWRTPPTSNATTGRP